MKLRLILILFVLVFSCEKTFGTDTTSLYKQRVNQIEQFSIWLKNKPISESKLDSSIWYTYDTAFSIFFDNHLMDSLFRLNTEVFTPAVKYQMLKIFIGSYDDLVHYVPLDSLRFKSVNETNSTKKRFSRNDEASKDFIVLCLFIDGKEYKAYGFFFVGNNVKPTGMTEMMMNEADRKIVRSYINQLSVN
jgi:hypothetical protein